MLAEGELSLQMNPGEALMRISPEKLSDRRRDRSGRILLTGGTGFLGSHLAAALLREGYEVILLARSSKGVTPDERMDRLFGWLGLSAGDRKKLRVVDAEIVRPRLGLDDCEYERLAGAVDEIVHCASNTSFSSRKKGEVEAANIGALGNILDLAASSGCVSFHLISTAYVAGKNEGLCQEALVRPDDFHNAYEETKCAAEWLAWERCREEGIRLSIYRPSIVCGDSRTGRSLLFSAVYHPVRTALFLKDLFEKDIREKGGKRAGQMGVRLEDDGAVHLPIRIEVREGAGVNVIPVDHFVKAFLVLMAGAPAGGIFHIVNRRIKPIEDIVEYAKKMFGLRGIEACRAEAFKEKARNGLEVLFDTYLEAYGPYMRDTRLFATDASGPFLEKHALVCPEFNYELFSKCMAYAVESGWGALLFPI
jgi:nucleoside-diphosphate-sugar epimerase